MPLALLALTAIAQLSQGGALSSMAWAHYDFQGGTGGTDFATVYRGQIFPSVTVPKRVGHSFAGYYSSPKGEGIQYYSSNGDGVCVCDWNTWESRTIYAKWTVNKYLVKFDANGGTGGSATYALYGSRIVAPKPTRRGYSFAGWTPAVSLTVPAHGVSYRAKWKPNKYKVAFSANGGKGTMSAQTMTYGAAAKLVANKFTRKGYVFIGWSKTPKGAVAYANTASIKNLAAGGTVTLFAQWAKSKYQISFYANGGKGKMPAQTMTYGRAAKLRANSFTRTGYVFIGWATSAANASKGKVSFSNGKAVQNLTRSGATIRLYAVWAKRNYRISFVANGGKGTTAPQTMTYGVAAKLRANNFTRPGYSFKGWAKTPGGSVAYANSASVKNLTRSGATITLYAVWKKNPVSPASPSTKSDGNSGAALTSAFWYGEYERNMILYRQQQRKAEEQARRVADTEAYLNRNPLSATTRGNLISQQSLLRTYQNLAREYYNDAAAALAKARLLSSQGR